MREKFINESLEDFEKKGLLRKLKVYNSTEPVFDVNGRRLINLSSNNYLNFANNEFIKKESNLYLNKLGTSASASRLVTGTLSCHEELEALTAEFKGYEAALVFGSGYLANIGTITALVGRNDIVIADRLVHASIIDAIKLSGAEFKRFVHNDVNSLEDILKKVSSKNKKLVITESVFSMDGDIAPLKDIADICKKYNAIFMVDEAHATGIFGNYGSGLINEQNLSNTEVDIAMGTYSKALGSYGGYVACSKSMRNYLINKARAFIYTTALPPSVIGASIGAIKYLKNNKNIGRELLDRADFFRNELNKAGLNTMHSQSQIVPIMVKDNFRCIKLAELLYKRGLISVAIRPPTVPPNSSRIRFTISYGHSIDTLKLCVDNILDCAKDFGIV